MSSDGVQYQVEKVGKPFSNIILLFMHNMMEFMHNYILAHWDYFLLFLGIGGLGIIR